MNLIEIEIGSGDQFQYPALICSIKHNVHVHTQQRIALHCVILLLSDEGGAGGQEFVVELQETVLVSEGEGEGMAVHRFAPDELVIQDAVEDVVSEYVHCDEDEDVAVETCVMALESEEEGVAMGDIPEDGLDPEQQDDDQDGCGDYLMISCKYWDWK